MNIHAQIFQGFASEPTGETLQQSQTPQLHNSFSPRYAH